jgi:hypothetical protein
MAELPKMVIDDVSDHTAGDWRYRARLLFARQTVPVELRLHPDSELRPREPRAIEAQLRRQREGSIDNYAPTLDQVCEGSEPVYLGFFP